MKTTMLVVLMLGLGTFGSAWAQDRVVTPTMDDELSQRVETEAPVSRDVAAEPSQSGDAAKKNDVKPDLPYWLEKP